MIKKSLMFLYIFILALFIVSAQNKIEIKPTKESFKAGEEITFIISLYDSQNSLINDNIFVIFEDAEKRKKIEKEVDSNKPSTINLGTDAPSGYWTLTAKYKSPSGESAESSSLLIIEENELADFELIDDVLTITNRGNARYTQTIQIAIGETIGTKKVDLAVGEKTSFRLIAPDGVYNVRITDGKINVAKSGVSLSGNVVGILDESLTERNPLTAGIRTGKEDDILSSIKNKSFVYVFFIALIGAVILLAIERRYRRQVKRR